MTMLASQITSLTVVYSIVYLGVNQRKHQSSASLAFVREIHRKPVNFPHKWPVTRKMFPFDDVIMIGIGAFFIPHHYTMLFPKNIYPKCIVSSRRDNICTYRCTNLYQTRSKAWQQICSIIDITWNLDRINLARIKILILRAKSRFCPQKSISSLINPDYRSIILYQRAKSRFCS